MAHGLHCPWVVGPGTAGMVPSHLVICPVLSPESSGLEEARACAGDGGGHGLWTRDLVLVLRAGRRSNVCHGAGGRRGGSTLRIDPETGGFGPS